MDTPCIFVCSDECSIFLYDIQTDVVMNGTIKETLEYSKQSFRSKAVHGDSTRFREW
jgi:hypothetical protein